MGQKRSDYSDSRNGAVELSAKADTFRGRQLEVTAAVYEDAGSVPHVVGSCILLTLAESRFVVTAGHVLDRRHNARLIIGVSPGMVYLSGEVTRLETQGVSSDEDDHIDLGIIKLAGQQWAELSETRFLRWPEIDVRAPLVARHTFGLVGFPCSKNRGPIRGDRMTSTAYGIAGLECAQQVYDSTGHDAETNLLVGFTKRDVWGPDGQRTAPDLYGVSGCGIWRYGRYLRYATKPPLLSAIAIEWHQRGLHKYIVGTRVHLVIAALVQKYAEVADYVRERVS